MIQRLRLDDEKIVNDGVAKLSDLVEKASKTAAEHKDAADIQKWKQTRLPGLQSRLAQVKSRRFKYS